MGHFVQRGGLWVLGQAVLLAAVLAAALFWHDSDLGPVARIAGIVLLVIGALCGLAGTVSLGQNLTPFPKPGQKTNLVQTGLYSLIRHPLYTAVFCGAVGWALVWQSLPGLWPALLLGPFFDAKARVEERFLRELFPEYAAYQQRVRRFIPFLY